MAKRRRASTVSGLARQGQGRAQRLTVTLAALTQTSAGGRRGFNAARQRQPRLAPWRLHPQATGIRRFGAGGQPRQRRGDRRSMPPRAHHPVSSTVAGDDVLTTSRRTRAGLSVGAYLPQAGAVASDRTGQLTIAGRPVCRQHRRCQRGNSWTLACRTTSVISGLAVGTVMHPAGCRWHGPAALLRRAHN